MKISENHVVTINYTLTNDQGEIIDKVDDGSFAYLHGAQNIIPGLESALNQREVGDQLNVKVPPQEGYGERDEARVETVPRSMFAEDVDIEPGMMFHAQSAQGDSITVTVVAVEDESVTIDANHALAGVELNFDVQVVGVREAEAVEIEHGHVHGPGGHHH